MKCKKSFFFIEKFKNTESAQLCRILVRVSSVHSAAKVGTFVIGRGISVFRYDQKLNFLPNTECCRFFEKYRNTDTESWVGNLRFFGIFEPFERPLLSAELGIWSFCGPAGQSWALPVFFSVFNNKKWLFCTFYQVNNLFLHQSYLKSPLPVKLTS